MAEDPAAVAETHVSVLVFVGDRVYKLKKPVSMGFLDFSTREAREAACHREVELNRRLAPDVYLGVADVSGPVAFQAQCCLPEVLGQLATGCLVTFDDGRVATTVETLDSTGAVLRVTARRRRAWPGTHAF